MNMLQRRLTKLEQASVRHPERALCALVAPPGDAPPDAWNVHQQQIEEALARGDFVAVVSSRKPADRPYGAKGVNYYRSDFEAIVAHWACSPSERGNAGKLADVLEGLSGNVIGPVACADCPTGW